MRKYLPCSQECHAKRRYAPITKAYVRGQDSTSPASRKSRGDNEDICSSLEILLEFLLQKSAQAFLTEMTSNTALEDSVIYSTTFSSTSTMSSSISDLASEPRSRSSTFSTSTQAFSLVNESDADDEIVWDISSSDFSSFSSESSLETDEGDDDFVLLGRARSATPSAQSPSSISGLTSELSHLSLRTSSGSSRKPVYSPPLTPVNSQSKTSNSKRRRRRRAKKEAPTGLGSRPIVDEDESTTDYENDPYDEAFKNVTSYLQNPSAYHDSRLHFLQSLIIELGLSTSSVPNSLKSAKAVIKSSKVFLNIRDYLAVRDKGPDAVKQIIYPSKSALVRAIRKQPSSRASLDWVKKHGLQVLLVTAYPH